MPDPAKGVEQPEATATPEAESPKLPDDVRSVLEAAQIDPDRVQSYLHSEAGYHKQEQRRMQENAETTTSIKELGQTLGETISKVISADAKPTDAAATNPIPHEEYAKAYGVKHPEDWQSEVTHQQLWDFGNRMVRMAQTRFEGLEGQMPEGFEGTASLGEMMTRLSVLEDSSKSTADFLRTMLKDGTMSEVAAEFPHARQGDVQEAIENAPVDSTEAFANHVKRAAKLSHDEVAGKIEAAELAERKKHIIEPVHLGGEGGAAVVGERSGAPAWSPQWIDEQERLGNI